MIQQIYDRDYLGERDMPQTVRDWSTELGLLPVPLFHDASSSQTFVLLNGTKGNFCLDASGDTSGDQARTRAWSANVGHYITFSDTTIEVQRWDRGPATTDRYKRDSVFRDLPKFQAYLEDNAPRDTMSVVTHALMVFRTLREIVEVRVNHDSMASVQVFLLLLASSMDQVDRHDVDTQVWDIAPESLTYAEQIRTGDWNALQKQLIDGRPLERLSPDMALVLRHALGLIFQESHYEVLSRPEIVQNTMEGFIPTPRTHRGSKRVGTGAYYTPPALARTLVEEALAAAHDSCQRPSLRLFDPSCGSGEFLRETVRQLELQHYRGHITIIGWDISPIACAMTRFALAWETRHMRNVAIDIRCVDALSETWPDNIDLIVMNPPFGSYSDLDTQQKRCIEHIMGKRARHRYDLSFAFLEQAAMSLAQNGILGAIMPSSFLNSIAARQVRDHLMTFTSPLLLAHLGSHSLFAGVMTTIALYLGRKGTDTSVSPVAFWSDHRPNSTTAGLRYLRKIRQTSALSPFPVDNDGYSVYQIPPPRPHDVSWSPRSYASWKILQQMTVCPCVRDLFTVYQGVRTGDRRTFVMTREEWQALPRGEQGYFRPAVVNTTIRHGTLGDDEYVFYPYDAYAIADEETLEQVVPTYYDTYLATEKEKLSRRSSVRRDKRPWWELSEPRASWQRKKSRSKIITTYFGTSGSFAWDETGDHVVVQGFAWIPKKESSDMLYRAYLAILNSDMFSDFVASFSYQIHGGQWDLSKRFVDHIPIPDLWRDTFSHDLRVSLASLGDTIHRGNGIPSEDLDEPVRLAYGIADSIPHSS